MYKSFHSIIQYLLFFIFLFSFYSCNQVESPSQISQIPQIAQTSDTTQIVQMVFAADLHYGLTRVFRGNVVSANIVNEEMVKQINSLPTAVFPNDGGVNAAKEITFIDNVAIGGDITNRQQSGVQSATTSWAQFNSDYLNGITLKNKKNLNTEFLLTCGNHDVSNAIGYPKALYPAIDNTSMVNIYNLMLRPLVPKTNINYDYNKDKPNYSKNMVGVHLMFVTMWPDSANRIWMEKDLASVSLNTPVIIFTHDPAAGESTHFTNPFGNHSFTADYEDVIEQRFNGTLTFENEFAGFLKLHPNIKAYFHGHTNFNEFYTFVGPNGDAKLNVFRVDSPMKGAVSLSDETKLSFQVLAINGLTQTLTVRECLWNTTGASSKVSWGQSSTISLK